MCACVCLRLLAHAAFLPSRALAWRVSESQCQDFSSSSLKVSIIWRRYFMFKIKLTRLKVKNHTGFALTCKQGKEIEFLRWEQIQIEADFTPGFTN